MFLHNKETDSLVEIEDVQTLINPNQNEVVARSQSGEEEQEPESMHKVNLIFPSGEDLPRCWMDADYRNP
jgi:hypothetical protein